MSEIHYYFLLNYTMVRTSHKHISKNQIAKKKERSRRFFQTKKNKNKIPIINNSTNTPVQGNVSLCSIITTELCLILWLATYGTDMLLLCLERILFSFFVSLALILSSFLFFCDSL